VRHEFFIFLVRHKLKKFENHWLRMLTKDCATFYNLIILIQLAVGQAHFASH